MSWETLWKTCLVVSFVAFAGMAVLVTIGGAKDIRTMIRKLTDKDN